MMTIHDVTTHAPNIFSMFCFEDRPFMCFFFFFFVCLEVSLGWFFKMATTRTIEKFDGAVRACDSLSFCL